MNTFGSQVVATHLEDDVHHIICAADTVINEIRDVLLKDNERLRDQVRRLLEVQGEQARDMMKEERKREVTMEWKAMEIERLNDLLIKQANVIEKITAERDALKAELLHQALKLSELADKAALTTAAQAETKVWKKLADANAVDAERYKADYESIIRLMAKWVNIYNREQVERYAAKVGVDPDELIAQTEAAIAARGE